MGKLRRARLAVSTYFGVMGLVGGVWMARIPAIKAQAQLSDGTLGVALFALPVGLVLGSFAAERLVDRVGDVPLMRLCGIGMGVTIIVPGLARNLAELMPALLVYGGFCGMLDVSQNAHGVRVEAAYQRPVITSMHACYSLGAILGALAGGAFAWAGVGPFPSLLAGGAVTGLATIAAGRWLLPGKGSAHPAQNTFPPHNTIPAQGTTPAPGPLAQGTTPAPGALAQGTIPAQGSGGDHGDDPIPVVARPVWQVVLGLGVLAIAGLVIEGAVGDWSAVYLRDNLGTSAGFAALGYAAFSVTMTTGRMVGDWFVHRFGAVRLTRAMGVISTAGLVAALATRNPVVTIAGLTLLGAGLSAEVPQVFAAGGRADPQRPGSGLAKVVGMGYAGQTAGPAVIGTLATLIGLRLAFGITILLAALIAVAAPALGWRGGRSRFA
jgi:fucose permease